MWHNYFTERTIKMTRGYIIEAKCEMFREENQEKYIYMFYLAVK